jgi:outer membrane receptor for ferrienterochelin and colicins
MVFLIMRHPYTQRHFMRVYILWWVILYGTSTIAQSATIKGSITQNSKAVEYANIVLKGKALGATTDTTGNYVVEAIPAGTYTILVSALGYSNIERSIALRGNEIRTINFELIESESRFNEVVVSGTMKEVSRLESPVPVELYTSKFFKANPTPSLFDALQNVNGVKPQLNCNICNTGDIHINGLEGPYTMILIDGMPIVSGLSTVYGLSGIPQSLIERVEVVKGPASTLYGSEAVGWI